jgi:phytanoyl-CoA hydroxylase
MLFTNERNHGWIRQMTHHSPEGITKLFERDGFVIFRNVLDADLIAQASEHVAWLQQRNPELRGEDLGHQLVAQDPFWVRLVSDDRLVDIAEQFVGPDIALFASHYICKPPYSGRPVLWHQDGAYWPLEPMKVVTLWLAIDDSTPENGCLRVIPRSHREDLREIRARQDVDSVLGSESAGEVDESLAVDITLSSGDVEVHHPNIMHGSNANTSPKRRCGLTIRYIPTSTRITSGEQPFPSALLLRGEPGVNVYQPWPDEIPGQW